MRPVTAKQTASGRATPPRIAVAVTTVGDAEAARALARLAVDGCLAACAQIEPIESVYRWQGQVCLEPEWRVSFKTTLLLLPLLRDRVLAAHPYELPQWLESEQVASEAYARWVEVTCEPGETP